MDVRNDESQAMSNTFLRRRKPRVPLIAPAVLVGLAVLSSVFFAATPQRAAPTLAQCRTMSAAEQRLACYDSLEGKPLPLPAKGGLAAAS